MENLIIILLLIVVSSIAIYYFTKKKVTPKKNTYNPNYDYEGNDPKGENPKLPNE